MGRSGIGKKLKKKGFSRKERKQLKKKKYLSPRKRERMQRRMQKGAGGVS